MDLFFALNCRAAAAGLCRSARMQIYLSRSSLTCPPPPQTPPLSGPFLQQLLLLPAVFLPRLQADGGWVAADGAPRQENAATHSLFMVHCKRNRNRLTVFGAWGWNLAHVHLLSQGSFSLTASDVWRLWTSRSTCSIYLILCLHSFWHITVVNACPRLLLQHCARVTRWIKCGLKT